MQTLMKCRLMRHFIWVFTVCQIPVYGTKKGQQNSQILRSYVSGIFWPPNQKPVFIYQAASGLRLCCFNSSKSGFVVTRSFTRCAFIWKLYLSNLWPLLCKMNHPRFISNHLEEFNSTQRVKKYFSPLSLFFIFANSDKHN